MTGLGMLKGNLTFVVAGIYLLNKLPNSTNSLFHILPLSFAEARESFGKLAEGKSCAGAAELAGELIVGNNCGSPEMLA